MAFVLEFAYYSFCPLHLELKWQTRLIWQSLYPFSGQNGEKKPTPFGAAHAYMAYIRKYPPPWPTCSRTLPPTEEKRGKGLATRRLSGIV